MILSPRDIHGLDAQTGRPVRVRAASSIEQVDELPGEGRTPGDTYVAPGWIDLQVNGFAGVDYNDPAVSHEAIARSIEVIASTGVTRCYPTVITGAPEAMGAAIANLARAKEGLPLGAVFDGLHVEGPHISPEDGPRGAHPARWVRPPDIDEFKHWQDLAGGSVRLVTLSPEWPGAAAYIEAVTATGVVVAIGHTRATATQIAEAVSAGATMSTHLGNGAHAVLPRHPNYIWDQLADDRLMASFIADGIHLPASFLKPAIRAKGTTRAVLVTDASAPAASAPGRYRLGEQAVDLKPDGRVVLAGQDRLAGSALRLDRALSHVMQLGGVTLADAVAMATTNAARAGRVTGRARGLVAGDRADLVRFRIDRATGHILIDETYVGGRCVYRRGE